MPSLYNGVCVQAGGIWWVEVRDVAKQHEKRCMYNVDNQCLLENKLKST